MDDTKSKKGEAFIVTSKGMYSYEQITKAKVESSKQLKEASSYRSQNDLVPPPFPPTTFLILLESNPIFARCVKQTAVDVAGLGWTLQLIEGKAESKPELERLNLFLDHPNDDDSFRTILKQLLIDYGSIGWFGIEVIRSVADGIAQVYHVPAHTINVHKDNDKYCQIRGTKKVWFRKYGVEKDISADEGKESKFDGDAAKDKANELIFHKNYYPRSEYYGAPDILPAIGDLMGAISQRDYNLAFFKNFGMPSAIMMLEGQWDEGAVGAIRKFVKHEVTGTENAHKTLVVKIPENENTKLTYTPMTDKQPKDAAFKMYAQDCRDDIMIAYSMPPERIGVRVTGKLGGNVANEATQVYVQGVIEPLQLDMESIINDKLLQSEIYKFKFNDIDIRNMDNEVERHVKMIGSGMETPNEARGELTGKEEYTEGDKFFIGTTLVEVGGVEETDEETKKIENDFLKGVQE